MPHPNSYEVRAGEGLMVNGDLHMQAGRLLDWDDLDAHFDDVAAYVRRHLEDPGLVSEALEWCRDAEPNWRAAGFDVLGVACDLKAELDRILLVAAAASITTDPSEDVRWSAAISLGRSCRSEAAPLLCQLSVDEDSDVRFQAVAGLPLATADDDGPTPNSIIEALVRATDDVEPEVREWAIFGLGVLLDDDSPRIRDVLAAHLMDSVAREDAIVGLCRRQDGRAFDALIDDLETGSASVDEVDAAGELGDPRILGPLRRFQQQLSPQGNDMMVAAVENAIGVLTTYASLGKP